MRNAFFAIAALLALNGCAQAVTGVASTMATYWHPLAPESSIRCHWEPSEDTPIPNRRQVCEYAAVQP